ncbi:PH domain-containing protein [Aggregicoccus sp. 17bor-14]|uniref:PH domain-containing protein n=1 Tax=Myxococcaceae TaxID=31 RepID=UPI00129C9E3C|nr:MULTISPECIES: PH domain-containing protein [Myxococcaceae]MBF5046032.1 PH domain-containing protein [Simulacricoccus sp. 17bor-14]MRI91763.1 PH domain-containing protein [Aggregicoccus sp. 17bor-14]
MLESLVLRVLRVPPEPSPPAGEAGSLRVFRASPRYLRYRQAGWVLKQLGALVALLFGLFFLEMLAPGLRRQVVPGSMQRAAEVVTWSVEGLVWAFYVVQLPFSYAVMQLDYRLRWYMVTDRSLRVREGILSLREKTMTFANVQQLSVQQGPLQRLLGIADVHLQSAGGGGAGQSANKGEAGLGESPHEARFRGVDNAAQLRDLVRERVRRYRDAGLGDHGDPAPVALHLAASQEPALAAARELLTEVQGLRAALAPSRT